jgi:hypothetical protein
MTLDLDTFLTTLYCLVDDLYQREYASLKSRRPGPAPQMGDSEVLTLALLCQWQSRKSERAFLRYAKAHWQAYFPRFLSQSAFNRRVRDLCGVLCSLGPRVGEELVSRLGEPPLYEVLDGVPVPLLRGVRGRRHRLFGCEAGRGVGGSDRHWYWGVRLLDTVAPCGAILGFVIGSASTEERWLAEALLRWRCQPTAAAPTAEELEPVLGKSKERGGKRQGPTGPIRGRLAAGRPHSGVYVADRGLRGKEWTRHWREHYGASVLTRADYEAEPCPHKRERAGQWLSRLRQVVETVHELLQEVLGLSFPKARTPWGVLTRLAAKVAAFNAALLINHLFARPRFSLFDPFG